MGKGIRNLLLILICLGIPAVLAFSAKPAPTLPVLEGAGGFEDVIPSPTEWYETIPAFNGGAWVVINDGVPFFTENERTRDVFEEYSDLDELGRCGTAFANVCPELMPTEERGTIGSIRPTGWHTVKYDVIADKYLYNRCHLIGYQLAGENANERNLITGTRYLNMEGMLPWENLVADYVKETGNHVLYRVTPYFEEENLVAKGVLMEGYSVEDGGAGVCFNVFCYNVQPGVVIDYATGESMPDETWNATKADNNGRETSAAQEERATELFVETAQPKAECDYVLNTNTMRFHLPSCDSILSMKEKNKRLFFGEREMLIENGYIPCGRCNP